MQGNDSVFILFLSPLRYSFEFPQLRLVLIKTSRFERFYDRLPTFFMNLD